MTMPPRIKPGPQRNGFPSLLWKNLTGRQRAVTSTPSNPFEMKLSTDCEPDLISIGPNKYCRAKWNNSLQPMINYFEIRCLTITQGCNRWLPAYVWLMWSKVRVLSSVLKHECVRWHLNIARTYWILCIWNLCFLFCRCSQRLKE